MVADASGRPCKFHKNAQKIVAIKGSATSGPRALVVLCL
jgi:hypothetical protein